MAALGTVRPAVQGEKKPGLGRKKHRHPGARPGLRLHELSERPQGDPWSPEVRSQRVPMSSLWPFDGPSGRGCLPVLAGVILGTWNAFHSLRFYKEAHKLLPG